MSAYIRAIAVLCVVVGIGASALSADEKPYWLDKVKEVHTGFAGERGFVAQFGDSITYSMAFWSVFDWCDPLPFLKDDGLPKQPEKRWRDVIKGTRAKEPENGNYSGWTVGRLLEHIDGAISRNKPEVAIIMIGTNDISGGKVPEGYREGLQKVIDKCVVAKCIPVLNTIPPKRGATKAVEEANGIIREVAQKNHVPLVDYYSEITKRRPGDSWDGTLIDADGVHPSAGETGKFDAENLSKSGYALRNWTNFLMYRQIYFTVLSPPAGR
jgi:lysophospholipase L1-like esterase